LFLRLENDPRVPDQDSQNHTCPSFWEVPADLAAIVAAWPDLPEAIRAGILAIGQAAHS
jgi:hypothetical protein